MRIIPAIHKMTACAIPARAGPRKGRRTVEAAQGGNTASTNRERRLALRHADAEYTEATRKTQLARRSSGIVITTRIPSTKQQRASELAIISDMMNCAVSWGVCQPAAIS